MKNSIGIEIKSNRAWREEAEEVRKQLAAVTKERDALVEAIEQMEKAEPVAIIEQLWGIIDDIDTYGDMAKSDDKLFRSLVERRQKDRWKTGITTDGYTLTMPNHPAAAVPEGWQLVPKEPTEAMLDSPDISVSAPCFGCWDTSIGWSDCKDIYKAMLAAAPKPEGEK